MLEHEPTVDTFLLIDTMGLVLAVLVTGADTHDAGAARTLMDDHRDALERVELIWGDSKYGQKELPEWVSEELDAEIEVKTASGRCR